MTEIKNIRKKKTFESTMSEVDKRLCKEAKLLFMKTLMKSNADTDVIFKAYKSLGFEIL